MIYFLIINPTERVETLYYNEDLIEELENIIH